ncbi:MAG: flagellar biosynthesis protein FlgL [Myxococcaceae bacterium]|nr:flagellar biosynthesis protein FlgL [Myxococcaceae bacterium]MCA3016708.1 flagellar biosynthesis protein FlgL [Myxococcaceae bacterium]
MRVSDSYVFDLANARLMRTRRESTAVVDQISSGKRVEAPWDDAAAAGLITRFAQERARQDSLMTAATRSSDELAAVDGALDQVTTALSRARELAVQLSNDTYSPSDRRNAAAEVQQLFQQVVGSLNLRFGDRYVFGGTADQAPPFDAAGAYLGNAATRRVEIAPGILQDASIRADVALKGAGGGVDVLASLSAFATALTTNDTTGIRSAVGALADGTEQLSVARSRAGAMMNVFDVAASAARVTRDDATKGRSGFEDVDLVDASTRYAATERALEASMSAAARSFRLSLLDKL